MPGFPGDPPREPSGIPRRGPTSGRPGSRFSPQEPALAVDAATKSNGRSLGVFRYLDVPLVVIALVPAIVLGAPVLGLALGTGGWILQRVIGEADRRWTRKVAEPVKRLGV